MSRRLTHCPGARAKRAYRNRHAARTAIERINARRRQVGQPTTRLWIYRCRIPTCGAFHLTHLPPDVAEARLRAVAQGLDPDQALDRDDDPELERRTA